MDESPIKLEIVVENELKFFARFAVVFPVTSLILDNILSTLPCFAIIFIGTFNVDLSDSTITLRSYRPNSASLGNDKNK